MVTSDRQWLGWAAVAVGVCAVVAAFAASSTPVGEGFAFGFGAFIAFFGSLAVLARNRRPDHWGLVVVGLAMFIVPFLGNGFTADPGASWTCWVAGALAMVIGGVGWTAAKTPGDEKLSDRLISGEATRSAVSFWLGRAALVVGLATVLLGIATHNTTAAVAVTIGLGTLIAVIAVWSLLAVDPTHDFLTLAITGFALFLSPWAGRFLGDHAAWTAWIAGALATALGVTGYLRGECLQFSSAVRDDTARQYRAKFGRTA